MFTLKFTIVNLMFIIQSSVFNNQYSIFGLGCSHFRNSMFRCSLSMSLFTVQGSFTNQCSPFNSQYSTLQCSLFKFNIHCSNVQNQYSEFSVHSSMFSFNVQIHVQIHVQIQCSSSMFSVQIQCSMFKV